MIHSGEQTCSYLNRNSERCYGVTVMPTFKNGTHINRQKRTKTEYLRISAGKHRGKYVHTLIAEAKIGRPLRDDETVEHKNGDGLDPSPDNIIVVFRETNTSLMQDRKRRENDKAIPD